jgi:hypothetical protein
MKTLVFTLFCALLSSSVTAQAPTSRQQSVPVKGLTVDASLPLDADRIWTGGPLKVTLRNNGTQSVKIISRMAMGYDGMNDSELYVLITSQSTEEEVGKELSDLKELVDYHASPVSDSDFKWLNPGETVTVEIDLKEWYDLPEGPMELVVVYSGDHASRQDPELLRGEYRSDKIKFTSPTIVKK